MCLFMQTNPDPSTLSRSLLSQASYSTIARVVPGVKSHAQGHNGDKKSLTQVTGFKLLTNVEYQAQG